MVMINFGPNDVSIGRNQERRASSSRASGALPPQLRSDPIDLRETITIAY